MEKILMDEAFFSG